MEKEIRGRGGEPGIISVQHGRFVGENLNQVQLSPILLDGWIKDNRQDWLNSRGCSPNRFHFPVEKICIASFLHRGECNN